MKMNRFIAISTICITGVLSVSAAPTHKITINGTEFNIEVDESLMGKMSGSKSDDARFVTCENYAGVGFFWVDTSCGAVWWASPEETKWVYYGAPDPCRGQKIGRYVPYGNKGGAGLFILDTNRGEGWWTNGQQWKNMGVPEKMPIHPKP